MQAVQMVVNGGAVSLAPATFPSLKGNRRPAYCRRTRTVILRAATCMQSNNPKGLLCLRSARPGPSLGVFDGSGDPAASGTGSARKRTTGGGVGGRARAAGAERAVGAARRVSGPGRAEGLGDAQGARHDRGPTFDAGRREPNDGLHDIQVTSACHVAGRSRPELGARVRSEVGALAPLADARRHPPGPDCHRTIAVEGANPRPDPPQSPPLTRRRVG